MPSKAELSEIKYHLEQTYQDRLEEVYLYGSEARGTAGADSDIDLLVVLKGPVHLWEDIRAGIRALYPLSLRLGRCMSPKCVDARDYRAGVCPFYDTVLREGIRL